MVVCDTLFWIEILSSPEGESLNDQMGHVCAAARRLGCWRWQRELGQDESITNSVLFVCFTISGLFGGTCINRFKPSLSLSSCHRQQALHRLTLVGGITAPLPSTTCDELPAEYRLQCTEIAIRAGRGPSPEWLGSRQDAGPLPLRINLLPACILATLCLPTVVRLILPFYKPG